MPLIELWRRGAKQHFKGLSDHLEKCQFTTYGVLCPNRSCHHCRYVCHIQGALCYMFHWVSSIILQKELIQTVKSCSILWFLSFLVSFLFSAIQWEKRFHSMDLMGYWTVSQELRQKKQRETTMKYLFWIDLQTKETIQFELNNDYSLLLNQRKHWCFIIHVSLRLIENTLFWER